MEQTITARYPSNIALVKYWGKHGRQLPCNASLSMTLSRAYTEVTLQLTEKKSKDTELDYYFEGQRNEAFQERVLQYVSRQEAFSELLQHHALRIDSYNSFPHSAGIASSASAFAAIAAVLLRACSPVPDTSFEQEAGSLARLGSGSACRSFYGPYALWGDLDGVAQSSDRYAIPVEAIHPHFRSMHDAILIVEDKPKTVSSSVGHALMNHHPYAEARFRDANRHCLEMITILKDGDFTSFISITEREALSLHAMMMTSVDYYMLIKPETVHIINQIFQFRKDTGLPLCFTLDAGPNVHLLYPEYIKEDVQAFLEHHLRSSLKSVIYDQAGTGGSISLNDRHGAI